jgi:hypothetical protein
MKPLERKDHERLNLLHLQHLPPRPRSSPRGGTIEEGIVGAAFPTGLASCLDWLALFVFDAATLSCCLGAG